ncbi:GGDEF domain-containing protein [Balnearium lithotrophicum]|nr:GGDEF domain-containing protein [Balnearium lithotrophicum]
MIKTKSLDRLFLIKTVILLIALVISIFSLNLISMHIAEKIQEENLKYISRLIAKEIQIINEIIPNEILIRDNLGKLSEKFQSIKGICFISEKNTICYPKKIELEIDRSFFTFNKIQLLKKSGEEIEVVVPVFEEYASEIFEKKKVGYIVVIYDRKVFENFTTFWTITSIIFSSFIVMIGIIVGISWFLDIKSNFRLMYKLLFILKNEQHGYFEKEIDLLVNSIQIKELKDLANLILSLYRKVNELNEKIKYLALKDSLSGLYNRNFLELVFKHNFINLWQRQKFPLSVAIIDLDDFKKINDNFGHQKGDEVLKKLGEIITREVRKGDFPIRYGGEEFLIIFPYAHKKEAYRIVYRIKEEFSKLDFGIGKKVTFSSGIAGYPEDTDEAGNLDYLLKLADKRLYKAKACGKNRIVEV